MSTIAIVGCGIAGDEAAFAARAANPDARIALFTDEPYPLYSACVLADYVSGEIPRQNTLLRPVEEYAEAGIELTLDTKVTGLSADKRLLLSNGKEIPFDALVIATGGRAQIPDIPGVRLPGVCAFKTLKDADYLFSTTARKAVVVGTGLVGIEAAASLCERGVEVTLLGRRGRILPRLFDIHIADILADRMRKAGIRVLLEENPLEILGDDKVSAVRTDKRTIDADIVVFGIGVTPEVHLAREVGAVVGHTGAISTDEFMCAGVPNIFACGDCAESRDLITGKVGNYQLWGNARQQGRVAGINAARSVRQSAPVSFPGSLSITTVNVFDLSAASVGGPAAESRDGLLKAKRLESHWGEQTLVMLEERLMGAQVLGDTKRLGALLPALLRAGVVASSQEKPLPRSPGTRYVDFYGRYSTNTSNHH